MSDSFKTRATLSCGGKDYEIFNVAALGAGAHAAPPCP
jgi:hypothetical protein